MVLIGKCDIYIYGTTCYNADDFCNKKETTDTPIYNMAVELGHDNMFMSWSQKYGDWKEHWLMLILIMQYANLNMILCNSNNNGKKH